MLLRSLPESMNQFIFILCYHFVLSCVLFWKFHGFLFNCKFMIHLQLIFVLWCKVPLLGSSLGSCMCVQLIQSCLLKRLSFLHSIAFVPLSHQLVLNKCIYFYPFSSVPFIHLLLLLPFSRSTCFGLLYLSTTT